jgi:hypothetical protein
MLAHLFLQERDTLDDILTFDLRVGCDMFNSGGMGTYFHCSLMLLA